MTIKIVRVYDIETVPKNAILIDRLWPRGITKEQLKNVPWVKELTPSDELRRWFHENKSARYKQFTDNYHTELQTHYQVAKQILHEHQKELVLLTATKDIEQSHVPTLVTFLEQLVSK